MVKKVLILFSLCNLLFSCDQFGSGTDSSGSSSSETELIWHEAMQDALTEAQSLDRYVLMLAGRDTCGNCTYMHQTVCESSDVKSILLDNFVTAYIDVDNSTDWYTYASGLGSFTLPLIAIIDPEAPDNYLSRTTSIVYEDDFIEDLQANLP